MAASASASSSDTSPPVCSICLEPAIENASMAVTKLKCRHVFHLSCIGCVFNVKGAMQCPNCRVTEDSSWLFYAKPNPEQEAPLDYAGLLQAGQVGMHPELHPRNCHCPLHRSINGQDLSNGREGRGIHIGAAESQTVPPLFNGSEPVTFIDIGESVRHLRPVTNSTDPRGTLYGIMRPFDPENPPTQTFCIFGRNDESPERFWGPPYPMERVNFSGMPPRVAPPIENRSSARMVRRRVLTNDGGRRRGSSSSTRAPSAAAANNNIGRGSSASDPLDLTLESGSFVGQSSNNNGYDPATSSPLRLTDFFSYENFTWAEHRGGLHGN